MNDWLKSSFLDPLRPSPLHVTGQSWLANLKEPGAPRVCKTCDTPAGFDESFCPECGTRLGVPSEVKDWLQMAETEMNRTAEEEIHRRQYEIVQAMQKMTMMYPGVYGKLVMDTVGLDPTFRMDVGYLEDIYKESKSIKAKK